MVFASPMEWFSDIGHTNATTKLPPETLGILSFETAKTMSRLVSLYKSLSDHEMNKLRKDIMRSQGVAYLNSKDEGFLLNLACAERLEELDHAAIAITLLGKKCSDFGLKRFDLVYTDLKLGIFDMGKLNYGSKEVLKIVEKMDKLIRATSTLYSSLESLTEMETSERKISQWRKNTGPSKKANFDLFDQKIAFQRKHVKHLQDVSLWSQTFNKSVGLMARIICIVYARICVLFSPYISGLPQFSTRRNRFRFKSEVPPLTVEHCLLENPPYNIGKIWKSGPIQNTPKNIEITRFYSQESNKYSTDDIGFGFGFGTGQQVFQLDSARKINTSNKIVMSAPPSTVGGAGLTLRYANVIIMAEKYLNAGTAITEDERDQMYQMLPDCLKLMVMSKLGKREQTEAEDELLANGWRDAVKGLMQWLVPMAEDTVKWHMERNMEKQKIDAKPTVLLLQTLHYSDKEKTEAAIAEVLVGLSFIFRYGNCHSGCEDWDSDSD